MKRMTIGSVLLFMLTACGGSAATKERAAEPEPSPKKDQRYSTVADLKDAAVEAGFACPTWKQDNVVKLAAESGNCSDEDVLSTYSSDGDLQQQLETARGLDEMLKEVDMESQPRLVGPNWIIDSPQAPALAGKMGGTVDGSS